MFKILTVLGARPQFIKAATISRVIKNHYHNQLKEIIVHTGQHYDHKMSAIFFDEMEIPTPDYQLATGGKSHNVMTGEMLIALEPIMNKEQPDLVLVYGDTNSTLAGSLAAAKLNIPVAHVEAGMRSFNRQMPEEINRVMTDHVARLLFCPSASSAQLLAKEGISRGVHVVGDVMFDAALFYSQASHENTASVSLPSAFYLATCHRQENTDDPQKLKQIFAALQTLAKSQPVIMPLHPRTKKYLTQYQIATDPITIIEPVGYREMLSLIKKSQMVLTDSGGMQKEAYFFDKPVVVMREETEWIELVDHNIAILTGANQDKITGATELLASSKQFTKNLYGDGNAADKIVSVISDYVRP